MRNLITASSNDIALLLLPNFNAMATMAFLDPLRAANYLSAAPLYRWEFLALDGRTVTASNGLRATSLRSLPKAESTYDLVFVCSSWAPEKHCSRELFSWLRQSAKAGAALGGIDTGAMVLGHAGLLHSCRATVHYEHAAAFQEIFPEVGWSDDLFVIDNNRLTCCGGMASADLALEIIRLQHGIGLANASARYIFHDRLRPASEGQSPKHHQPVGYAAPAQLQQAIIQMERNLEDPLSMGEIARASGLSLRTLERLFRRHTGVSPVRYYQDVRLDRARGMITQTEMSVMEISVACGFSSPDYFSRIYKRRFGLTPSADRVEGRVPFQFRAYPAHAGT